jgi:hypothetical protein
MAKKSYVVKLLKVQVRILVTEKVASAGGARFGCGEAIFGPPVDATAG